MAKHQGQVLFWLFVGARGRLGRLSSDQTAQDSPAGSQRSQFTQYKALQQERVTLMCLFQSCAPSIFPPWCRAALWLKVKCQLFTWSLSFSYTYILTWLDVFFKRLVFGNFILLWFHSHSDFWLYKPSNPKAHFLYSFFFSEKYYNTTGTQHSQTETSIRWLSIQ